MSGTTWDDGRLPYHLRQQPKASKPKGGLRRESRKRAPHNRKYNQRAEEYRELNPTCAYCGMPTESCDHICSGGNKAATLMDFDTINPSCNLCNGEHYQIDVKVLAKLRHVLRRIEQRRGRRLSTEQMQVVIRGLSE